MVFQGGVTMRPSDVIEKKLREIERLESRRKRYDQDIILCFQEIRAELEGELKSQYLKQLKKRPAIQKTSRKKKINTSDIRFYNE